MGIFKDALIKDLDTTFFNENEFATLGSFVFYKNALTPESKQLLYVDYTDVVSNAMEKQGIYTQGRTIFVKKADIPPYVNAGTRILIDNLQYSISDMNPQDAMIKLSMDRSR